MPASIDGPVSPLFTPLPIKGNVAFTELKTLDLSNRTKNAVEFALSGSCVGWGIPFEVGDPVWIKNQPVTVSLDKVKAPWLVVMHTADVPLPEKNASGFVPSFRGWGRMGDRIADYVFVYADGSEVRIAVKTDHQIGGVAPIPCTESVIHRKPIPLPGGRGERVNNEGWGWCQTRATTDQIQPWLSRLWAWDNPHPEKEIVGLRVEPTSGGILLFGITSGNVSSTPIRWETRRKALMTLPDGEIFDPILSDARLKQIQLDMGQVISAKPQPLYPNETWEETYSNQLPAFPANKILVEYTAHPEARFHLSTDQTVSVKELNERNTVDRLEVVPDSLQKVTIRTVEKDTGKEVPVKLHLHGEFGEYLAPVDRQRTANPFWFQDLCVDFTHRQFQGLGNSSTEVHHCTYISGRTEVLVPRGRIYLEVSKGFEIRPVRRVFEIAPSTEEIVVELEKVLHWREEGWVTADTHVHFLAPSSALIEGAGEGVNLVNLLASQWGELMTNVGDFDGTTTYGAKEAGGDGEYLVRVGTENRQHVLGHISLLGYTGGMINPLCSGGPDESALGDPVGILLTEWAMQCRKQNGVVVLPHFPYPRLENAATIVSGNADGVEMTAWGNLYGGIDPYSLSDWYRYLNCGYFTAAVAGTDKMSADTAVGTVRTYARIDSESEFNLESWKAAVQKGRTFVTYGPLMEYSVEGKPAGSRIELGGTGGRVDVQWNVASATIPMSRVDLVVNGEIVESRAVDAWKDDGSWSVPLDKCSWLALLVRGHYQDKTEIIAAHSSPVMVQVEGTRFLAAADAVTILEQIEGALAYIDTIGTRAEEKRRKEMKLVLTGAYRELHNRLHQAGHFHDHGIGTEH